MARRVLCLPGMRPLLAALLLAAGCSDRPLAYVPELPAAAPCGHIGEPCCAVKSGCDADPATGRTLFTDCVSPPDLTSPGVCVAADCGTPNHVACDVDGQLLCEFNYGADADGVCRFLDL